MKAYFKRYFIAFFFIVIICFQSIAQPDFVVDTIILPGQYIQKASCKASSDVWAIADTNSRRIFRIDKNLSIYDHSSLFQASTLSKFSTILNVDTNFTLVGTQNDYLYNWNNNIISKINSINGLTDSTINAIVGIPYVTTLVSSNAFRSSDYINYSSFGGGNEFKFLACYDNNTYLARYNTNNEDRLIFKTASSFYDYENRNHKTTHRKFSMC